ncbi:MAG: DUF1294 domain-containing protein [Clostridia bacterium]|nr:DUF1294 domain-containing protein [Clostridia bacterium]
MVSIYSLFYNNWEFFLAFYFIIINITAFVTFGIDKHRSIKKLYRISEKTLFSLSFLGGATMMFFGMCTFRHKTRKTSFMIVIPLLMLFHLFLILYLETHHSFLSNLF